MLVDGREHDLVNRQLDVRARLCIRGDRDVEVAPVGQRNPQLVAGDVAGRDGEDVRDLLRDGSCRHPTRRRSPCGRAGGATTTTAAAAATAGSAGTGAPPATGTGAPPATAGGDGAVRNRMRVRVGTLRVGEDKLAVAVVAEVGALAQK